jgi:hypothetical protein
MRFLQLFLLIFTFQVEIKVKAEVVLLAHMSPQLIYSHLNQEIKSLGQGAVFNQENKFKFIDGHFRFKNMSLETSYGQIEGNNAEFWVKKIEKHKISVSVTAGSLVIRLSDKTKLQLSQGYGLWISGLDENKKNRHGVLEPLDIKEFLRNEVAIDQLSKEKTALRVSFFKENWGRGRIEKTAEIYKAVVLRHIASIAELEAQKQRRKELGLMQRKRWQSLLHKTAFEK